MKDLRQTPDYAKYMESIGWQIERIGNHYCHIRNLPLVGKVIKIQRTNIAVSQLNQLIKKYNPFQIIYEPLSINTLPPSFSLSKSPYLPSKTIHIDLTKSEKVLLSQMHQKTRYNIKVAKKNDLTIEHSNNIEEFAKFWSKQREGFSSFLYSQSKDIVKFYNAFEKNIDILIVRKDGGLISGILMPRTKDIAYYMYAASSNKGKKLHAPTLLTWEAIKLAKKRKCKIFDFEGIYDERFPLVSWKGFTKFKKTFGGKEIEHPGCFIKNSIF